MKRSLKLTREALVDLTTDELHAIPGGDAGELVISYGTGLNHCISKIVSCFYC